MTISKIDKERWGEMLPKDLSLDEFAPGFEVCGIIYKYGAWNESGNWWLAWNTEEELLEQLHQVDLDTIPPLERY